MSARAVKSVFKQTDVGVIPQDWKVELLDAVAKRGSGHTPDKTRPEYWGGDVRWISLQDSSRLDRLYIVETAENITDLGIANSSARLHPKGTVVLSRDAGVGKSAIMAAEMAVSQHFMAWTCGSTISNHFLYYWLQSKKAEFERIAIGNTIKTIGLPYFKSLRLPLPERAEQEAIAEALGDVDAFIEALEQILSKKRDLKQGAMQELLTGNCRLPNYNSKWDLKTLGAVASINKGLQLIKDHETLFGKYPHLNGGISPSSYTDKWNMPANTITISEGGNSCGYVQLMAEPFWCGGHCYGINPLSADNQFLYQAIKWRQPDIMGLRVGSGLPNIQKTALTMFKIDIPVDQNEQIAIASVLSDMDAEINTLEHKLNKAREVKAGMMQQLLTGQVRLI